jgi:hypothetical protein
MDGKPICLPGNFSPERLKLMLDRIVNDRPDFASLPALPALAAALQASFPCRGKK